MVVETSIEDARNDEYPNVLISCMSFNDGTALELEPGSIVVFTGANNSGKSQALRDIENYFDESKRKLSVVVKQLECTYSGTIGESFLRKFFFVNEHGYLEPYDRGGSYDGGSLLYDWNNQKLPDVLRRLLVKRISTEMRLVASNSLSRNDPNAAEHPIFKMMKSERLAKSVSNYFRQAFGEDLVVDRSELRTISLHMGTAPIKTEYTIETQDEYYEIVGKLPKLQEQGDGMRSFASILLNAFTSEFCITLIDEPEAFLHPPQARILGKMFARNNPENRQLIISTHSEDFLQGLLDADSENVTIVRINRSNDVNRMSPLANGKIRELWTNPILRYSNILSGLFHEKVVVCESDYDCLFYQAIMNAIFESKGEIAPDILFTHCGGKTRAKDIVRGLKAVNVPVVAICDFDLLDSGHVFRPLIEACGVRWDEVLSRGMKDIYDSMNAKSSNGNDAWKMVKKIGKAGFEGCEPAAYERVEAICRSVGLYVVPCGEMECFDKTINKDKKDWVYYVLENYDLAVEPKMNEAREFVLDIVNYKPPSALEPGA